jgi:transposase
MMNTVARIGVDLAKNVMQVHGVDGSGNVVIRKSISRDRFAAWFANLAPCHVAMEACSSSNYWARTLHSLGHDVVLIAPQFVTPYRKGGKQVKNDALDAEAICEAASRPHMRFVPIKTPAQQSVMVIHRMRTGFVEERTALTSRLRALLGEFGVFIPQGIEVFRTKFAEALEDASNALNGLARTALLKGWEHWQALSEQIASLEEQIALHANQDNQARQLLAIVGVGPITASATLGTIVDARQFKNGRQMAAWIGLVPKQASSGGKSRLGHITKKGNDYLRTLLVQGARTAITTAARRHDRLSRWIVEIRARLGWSRTLIAVANKHARIMWAILAKGERFDPSYVSHRPGSPASHATAT